MKYVYILQSIDYPDQFYTGLCTDVHYFERSEAAVSFERYLKTGSGRAFASKRLR